MAKYWENCWHLLMGRQVKWPSQLCNPHCCKQSACKIACTDLAHLLGLLSWIDSGTETFF